MNPLLVDIAYSFVSAMVFLTVVFIIAHLKRRYDLIDSAWGPTFIVIALSLVVRDGNTSMIQLLLLAMVSAWGLRLAYHVFRRFLASSSEDPRYIELRKKWPARFIGLQTYLRIYLVQGLLATIISLPVIIMIGGTIIPAVGFASLGIAIWLIGFIIEIMADMQLKIFLSVPENRGKLMTDGLWAYSRHPNYFGEVVLWWGIGLMTYGTMFASLGLLGPLVITLLIVFVSGIPPAERRSRTKPGWNAYAKKTNALIPWPPRDS